MKKNSGYLVLPLLLAAIVVMLIPQTGRAGDCCPICGKTAVESSAWAQVTALETKPTWSNAFAPRAFCFDPGTPDEEVMKLVNRIYNNPASYIASSRWTSTASGTTGGQGDPTVLTYSFVPDGVTVPDSPPPNGFGNQTNNIHAMMTAKFGSVAAGKAKFREAFNEWQNLTGLTYIEETNDDGAALFSSSGVLGVRGDIRISAVPMDGSSGVLAYNYFPNTGDMVLDNAENWQSSSNNYRFFRNVVSHEAGHGIGLSHVCPADCQFLMEPFVCTAYDGPQHDDIRGAQRQYGDTCETNNTAATATMLGAVSDGTTTMNNLSIDDNSDQDYYSFTVPTNRQITITAAPVGLFFDQCAQNQTCSCTSSDTTRTTDDQDLSLRLYDTNGTTVLAEASSNGYGLPETISATVLPGAGTYFIRVYPAGSVNAIQVYNLSFTLSPAILETATVTLPNGGESWTAGTNQTITWTTTNVTGNMLIELNRNYPIGTWETLFASTPNDGSQSWTVTGTASSSNCRVRVTSINAPSATDESNADFTIIVSTITVVVPDGGEVFNGNAMETISWTTNNVTGNILIELNRDYPGGTWENLATVPNAGASIALGGPATTNARIRLTSVNEPVATDVSDASFSIVVPNFAPEITHDPHGDGEPGNTVFTALVTDDAGPITTTLFYRASGGGAFSSTNMPVTGNPDEYSAILALTEGSYDYYIRAADGVNTVYTDTMSFDVGTCPTAISFDDGSAEGYNWAGETGFEWAVKYTPESYPFLLCGFEVAVAKFHPDTAHSPIQGRVYLADGTASLPGTMVLDETSGSIGNVVGGLPSGQVVWATVSTLDGSGDPLILNGPFYVSVGNPAQGKYEAFGRDDNTASANSYFFDGCDSLWFSEEDLVPNAQGGQRMIRLLGSSSPVPSDLVIIASGSDIVLYWADAGAPYYRVYSSTVSGGPFTTLEGSTSSTTFTDTGAADVDDFKFYIVVSSATP
ncbi:MAG: matrixin family metalloprotease [Calditrichaeota bacterium]|nr:matrixin family metalloprotease [Calditrichota bacterium]MCB9367845.1 matrixin family metalloprotease [Calditrichota bacterium]